MGMLAGRALPNPTDDDIHNNVQRLHQFNRSQEARIASADRPDFWTLHFYWSKRFWGLPAKELWGGRTDASRRLLGAAGRLPGANQLIIVMDVNPGFISWECWNSRSL